MTVQPATTPTAFIVVDALAILLTFFRLGFRLKIQRFWWEDVWAAVASLCTVVLICSSLVVTKTVDPNLIFLSGKIEAYIVTSITWSVRMSIIFSIIRITSSTLPRRILFVAAACFVLFWAATFGLQSQRCVCLTETNTGSGCMRPALISIFELITNTISDVTTLLFSLKLLWRVNFPIRKRIMILFLFTSSRYLFIFSLARTISQLANPQGSSQQILGHLQVTVFMLVCNMVVVVTFLYRVFWVSRDDSLSESETPRYDDDFTAPLPRTEDLTTVDLDERLTGFTSELGSICHDSLASTTNQETSSGPGDLSARIAAPATHPFLPLEI